ncbi:Non-canonical non-ribosomal peptide synthetase FUB8 [Pseudocercospora fuligena]|uniref:Non-canonical non-ribosomal peptide synthetase FUB8 n=1 Tax=Pseudocercospora fuligena TaxID=685502 RepID=A0A8H6RJI2_9PEZI|nr:Non-canonical non-ribosomal peptide synthetase FUB8 [Pseudocercospora fuligena]
MTVGSHSDQQLLTQVLISRAKHSPDRVFGLLPKGEVLEDGFSELTYAALNHAVDNLAFWIDQKFGGKVQESDSKKWPTIPYIGPNDVRYTLLTFAAMKTKRRLMLPLPSNAAEGMAKLLQSVGTDTVLAGSTHTGVWEPTRSLLSELNILEIPEVKWLLETDIDVAYPYARSFEEGHKDTIWFLQTSGTTGDPKPINMTHQLFEDLSNHMTISAESPLDRKLGMMECLRDAYQPILVPLSWGAGTVSVTNWPLAAGTTPIFLPTNAPQPMTSEYLKNVMNSTPKGKKNIIMLTPATIRELARDPSSLEAFRAYDSVGYAGAPLDQATGDLISQYTRVQSYIGSTDSGVYPLLLDEPKDWNIHRFYPDLDGFHLQLFDEREQLYELCINRQPDEYRYCFVASDDSVMQVFHTKDLWKPVPGRPEFYTGGGRVDDFVKLASLTKFNGVKIESIIDRDPQIESCIVAGEGRLRPFALIQLRENVEPKLESIWPTIQEVNKSLYAEAELCKELIMFTNPEKPILRTAKGTVSRRKTIEMYESKIEEMYADAVRRGLLKSMVDGANWQGVNGHKT